MSVRPLQSLVNGQQVELISIRDRGFQYGDGCFETIRLISNIPILWSEHQARLRRACKLLDLAVDFELLLSEMSQLLELNSEKDAVLKITVTRGESGRGYAPDNSGPCTRVLQLTSYSPPNTDLGAKVVLCQHRLSSNTLLAGIKHLNRLDQVIASAQIPEGFDEGLCMDEQGNIIEACKSNLLIAIGNELISPELGNCGVEGIMLNHLIEKFETLGKVVNRRKISRLELLGADEILLCNSVFGVWPVVKIEGENCNWESNGYQRHFTVAALQIRDELIRGEAG
jgi:4-amino-4-deoxychorismate lyase